MPSSRNKKLLNTLLLLGLFVAPFENCGSQGSSANGTGAQLNVTSSTSEGTQSTGPTSTVVTTEANYGENQVLKTMQPTIAVRGTGCIMCHSSVTGNVITDLGFGDVFYYAGNTGSDADTWYTDDIYRGGSDISNDNWLDTIWSAAARSIIYVPRTPAALGPGQNLTLAQWMKQIMGMSSSGANTGVTEVSSLYIGAPTAAQIRQLGGLASGQMMKFIPNTSLSPKLSGFSAQNGGVYYGNNGSTPVICDGDVVIDGIVWLNNATIATYSGCRIYATQSIFVNGPITYSTTIDSQTQNLQLSSASMIAMGVGHGCDNSYTYLQNGSANFMGEIQTRSGVTIDQMFADATALGPGLTDSVCEPNGQNTSFAHLLVNAPFFFSWYSGNLSGSIIAELAFSARGVTSVYSYDPAFQQVPTLALLPPSMYLSVSP